MANYDTRKPEMDVVTDVQFNASMDALLENESFARGGSGSPDASYPPSADQQATLAVGGASIERANQGLRTTQTTIGVNGEKVVYSLPQVPYSVAANNAVPLPADMQGFMGNVYQTAVERSAHGLNQDQCPIMPAPAISAPVDHAATKLPSPQTAQARAPRRRSSITSTGSSKRMRDASAVSEDEGEKQRRRQDRNAREQQRSHRITEQIDQLKQILGAANVPFKPDKFSTLVTISDYIKQLQAKSAMLDAEHKKLIDTISKTNDIVNDQNGIAPLKSDCPMPAAAASSQDQAEAQAPEGESCFVGPSVDYRSVFTRCGVALAVLSIDGRFLDCNKEFERITGQARNELLPTESMVEEVASSGAAASASMNTDCSQLHARNLSLFNLLARDCMEGAFMAMSEMLKHPVEEVPAGTQQAKDYWTGGVSLSGYADTKVWTLF